MKVSDKDIVDWIEKYSTLHMSVKVLYVVDGYQIAIMYDDHVLYGPIKGDTLRKAYYKIIDDMKRFKLYERNR